MFGLTFPKLALIGIIAVVIIGPERLPQFAARLGSLVKSLRGLTDTARERVREEMGPDFDDIDWKKLDPRQYDPRRIIREALLEDSDDDTDEDDETPTVRLAPKKPATEIADEPAAETTDPELATEPEVVTEPEVASAIEHGAIEHLVEPASENEDSEAA
jgi:sec-independent protein translocase protein TatB